MAIFLPPGNLKISDFSIPLVNTNKRIYIIMANMPEIPHSITIPSLVKKKLCKENNLDKPYNNPPIINVLNKGFKKICRKLGFISRAFNSELVFMISIIR